MNDNDNADVPETYGQFDVALIRHAQMSGDGNIRLFMETVDHGKLCMVIRLGELIGTVSAIVRYAPQAANFPSKEPLIINGGKA